MVLAALLAGCAAPGAGWVGWPRAAAGEPAKADAGLQAPFPPEWAPLQGQAGLLYERDDRELGQVLHWLRLDLQDPSLQLSLTPPAQKGRPLDRFDEAARALVTVNASFFTTAFVPRGWTVSEGQAWTPVLAAESSPLLTCDRLRLCTMTFKAPIDYPAGTWTAVGGTPWLVRAGRARQAEDDQGCAFCIARHPRTALGLDATGRYLLIVLVEGRQAHAEGLALADLARRMVARGAAEALNLDGGGSTALLIQGQAVSGRPFNEQALRPVANALVIKSIGTAATAAPSGPAPMPQQPLARPSSPPGKAPALAGPGDGSPSAPTSSRLTR